MKIPLALAPIVLIFSLAILSRSSTFDPLTIADESKFYQYAENITNGFYTDAANPLLKEGPGYPLYIALPVALDLPLYIVRISNILLLTLAAFYLFMILKRYVSERNAIILTYVFALYPPLLRWANLMYAESLEMLLLLGFSYHFIVWYHREGRYRRQLIYAILFLGYLALTKIIFAYVILCGLAGSLALRVLPKIAEAYQLKRLVWVFAGALLLLMPYVAYTYSLTGKFFYMGTHGGLILYHRATPYENEFGNSYSQEKIFAGRGPRSRGDVNVNLDQLQENHLPLFKEIEHLTWIEKDNILKERAIQNMKEHPKKYVENTIANISRILFHYPFSYRIQNLETLGYLIPNMFIVVLAVLGIYPAFAGRKRIPKELIVLLLMALLYLGGHSLLGGRGRFFIPAVPLLLIFFSFVYYNILQIKMRTA